MIDIAPTAAVSAGASLPAENFATGLRAMRAGPAAALDVGVLLGSLVLPHVRFERAWLSCTEQDVSCGATNDVLAPGIRLTSRGRFRVFVDAGIGFRRLTTDPTSFQIRYLALLDAAEATENRTEVSDGSRAIRWTGVDRFRSAVGVAYAVRDELALELQLDWAIGDMRHVRTASFVTATLNPGTHMGYEADVREDARRTYVIVGLSLAIRGFLPIR